MTVLNLVAIRNHHLNMDCRLCNLSFQKTDYRIISKNTAGYSGRKIYHIQCARKLNMLGTDIWWNRLARYKRYEILNAFDIEPDIVGESSQLCYAKLSEEVKTEIDIYCMERKS